jgi:hypothetical protein
MNTPTRWLTTAKILDEKRRAVMLAVFDDAIVPIKSMFTVRMDLPNHPQSDAYQLDIDALTMEQRFDVITLLSKMYKIDRDQAEMYFYSQGVPILAKDVSVCCADPAVFISPVEEQSNGATV